MSNDAFLAVLMREVFQTEQSAMTHGERTAGQLGNVPPARVLRKAIKHAEGAMADLHALMATRPLPDSRVGRSVGRIFSFLRQFAGDQLMSKEKTFRFTLIGMHHGIDLITMLEAAATSAEDQELARWCRAWLRTRQAIMRDATAQLVWFGKHPEVAMEPAGTNAIARAFHRILNRGMEYRQGIRERAA